MASAKKTKFLKWVLLVSIFMIPVADSTLGTNSIDRDRNDGETLSISDSRAARMKNEVRGPADMGIYYVNSPGGK